MFFKKPSPIKSAKKKLKAFQKWYAKRVHVFEVSIEKRAKHIWGSPLLKRVRHITWASVIISSTLAVVLISLFAFYSLQFEDKILVKVKVPGADLSGLTPDEAERLLETNYAMLTSVGIPFEVDGKSYVVPIEDMGIEYDLSETVTRAFAIGHSGDFWRDQIQRLKAIFVTQHIIDPAEIVNVSDVEKGMRASIPEIREPAKDAYVVVEDNEFRVVPSAPGTTSDFAAVIEQVIEALDTFEPKVVSIEVKEELPEVLEEEAERAIALAVELASNKVTLQYEQHAVVRTWEIDMNQDKGWVAFQKDGPVLQPVLNATKLRAYLDEVIAPDINQVGSDATVIMPAEEGTRFVTIEGVAEDGYTLLIEDTVEQVVRDVANGTFTSSLQVAYEPGRMLTSEGVDLGLHDLLSVGRSNFANSPQGRADNIRYGLSKYNGLLIPSGGTFSFVELLGPVDNAHGWANALAIFNGGASTESVPGGGLCQVSTTIYRAAVQAGLPIVERRAHSFYVSYYTFGGDGLDATIYDPSPDLKFLNDTPGNILVQAYTEGTDAYVKFYGTNDGRIVTLDGPHKSGWTSSGGPVYQDTTDLAPGVEIEKFPVRYGRGITWYQTIEYPDGQKVSNTIVSKYASVPALIRRGVAPGSVSATGADAGLPVRAEVIL